jgi:hypothetical protein
VKMKIFSLLASVMMLTIIFGAVAPALACEPELTYDFIAIGYPDPKNPGTRTMTDNVTCVKDAVSIGVDYGYPWGEGSHYQVVSYTLNLTDYSGQASVWVPKTFGSQKLEFYGSADFKGLGTYTYHGPEVTVIGKDAQNNSIRVKVNDGAHFFGLLQTGQTTGCGTINNQLLTISEKVTAVSIVTGPLAGVAIVVGTGTYTVLECEPELSYNFVAIGHSDPSNPGTAAMKGNVTCVVGAGSAGVDYGYPWGKARHYQVNNYDLNLTSYTGSVVGWVEKTFRKGTLELVATAEFKGLGNFTYHGPTVTVTGKDAQNNSIRVKVTDGMQFFGLLNAGGANGCGVINRRLVTVSEEISGVTILGGPLNGFGLIVGTGTYTVSTCTISSFMTFKAGVVQFPIANTGNTTIANGIIHAKGRQAIANDYGHPWGPGIGTATTSFTLDIANYTGTGNNHVSTTYRKGTLELWSIFKFNGLGWYTYCGPTFTVTNATGTKVVVSSGMQFYGLLYSGIDLGYGTFDCGRKVVCTTEQYTGVSIMAGPLQNLSILSPYGSYLQTRNVKE